MNKNVSYFLLTSTNHSTCKIQQFPNAEPVCGVHKVFF